MSARGAVLGIFILSGAAGLIYEIVWARQLVLVFGNTTQAVSAILTGFFGGMAIGSVLGGRIADRVGLPLRLYGAIEVVLVAIVLATPLTFSLIHEVYRGIYPALEASPQALALVRLGLALLALGPATVLMGATLPILTRHLTREAHLSQAFGRLYAANTIGAIAGTLAAGLVLIEVLGLSGALAVGAACSGVAGVTAVLLSLRSPGRASVPAHVVPGSPVRDGARARPRLALVVAFVSGLTSLGYQVLWTRLLASGTGNTTYVFTLILGVFLAGIALGAVVFSLVRTRLGDPVRVLSFAQLAVAVLAFLGLVWLIGSPHTFTPSRPLETIGALVASVVIVVLPVTLVLGLAFPAASALLPDGPERAGTSSGALLGVNTAGAIAGSLVIPFFLIPALGSPVVVAMLASINAAFGTILALLPVPGATRGARGPVRRSVTAAIGAAVGLAIVVASLVPGTLAQPNETWIRQAEGRVFESAEDEIASVQAGQIRTTPELWVAGTSMTLLTIDAKLMPILPLMARPEAEDALIVAFGMGSSYRAALIAGLRTEAVELVPSVVDMFDHYYPDAEAFRNHPNGRIIVADGRNHLELSDEVYDIIVTDPPPPIESSGASVISSLEYYEAGRDHLAPGGIMMQWTPHGTLVGEFERHLRTFARVFPHVLVARGPGGYGNFMLGSEEPIELTDEGIRSVLERPGVLAELSSAYDSPQTTLNGWLRQVPRLVWLSGEEARARAGDGPIITDDRPLPEYFLLRRLFGFGEE